jgi:hypothetical protein
MPSGYIVQRNDERDNQQQQPKKKLNLKVDGYEYGEEEEDERRRRSLLLVRFLGRERVATVVEQFALLASNSTTTKLATTARPWSRMEDFIET